MTAKVGPKGQVVIPKQLRDRLGIGPGDEVDFVLDQEAVKVFKVPASENIEDLAGSLKGHNLTGMLEQDRRRERER